MAELTPVVAPHIAAVSPYVPGKQAEEVERELGIASAVKLASNESPLGPSPHVREAVRLAAETLHRYSDDAAFQLRGALAERLSLHPDELALGHGSNELIDLCVRTFATQTEHAVIGAPSFACYGIALRVANVPTTVVPLREGLFWDLAAIEAAIRPETKLIFLDNPNNPTSTHIAGGALEGFLRRVPPSVIVVVDEAYADFVEARDYASVLTLRGTRERLIMLRTFSKAYALASLRLGYAVGPAALLRYLDHVRLPFNVNGVAQAAAIAALADTAHLERGVALNRTERARVSAALAGLGLAVAPSQTNFVCVRTSQPAGPIYGALLRQGVIVRPFGPCHLRISIGLPDENDRLLATLPAALSATAR